MRALWWLLPIVLYIPTLFFLVVGVPATFTSPDENAAFVFADRFRSTGTLTIPEPRNVTFGGILHPRSVVALGAELLPGSFLGFPMLAGLFGMQFLTPVLALIAIFAWRSVIFALTRDRLVANIASVLLGIHGAFWYYSARTMMHNVAFVAFLIFAAWWIVGWSWPSRRAVQYVLAGLSVGIALAIRTAEAPWVMVSIVAIGTALRVHVRMKHVLTFATGLLLPIILLGVVHANLYGSPFMNGYIVRGVSPEIPVTTTIEENTNGFGMLSFVFPFGIHERAIVRNVWHFGIALFPLMSLLAVIGVGMVALRRKELGRTWAVLLLGTGLLALWLGVVYGSWSFNDNPDPVAMTLADSHVRYWLPLFVLTTPFAAFAIVSMTARKLALIIPLLFACTLWSFGSVALGEDGLFAARRELFESAEKRALVVSHTEDDAVIIVDRADKFLWPSRAVIVPLRDERTYATMPLVAAAAPLYYFGIPFPERDIAYLNDQKLAPLGLRIAFVAKVFDEALYHITAIE